LHFVFFCYLRWVGVGAIIANAIVGAQNFVPLQLPFKLIIPHTTQGGAVELIEVDLKVDKKRSVVEAVRSRYIVL